MSEETGINRCPFCGKKAEIIQSMDSSQIWVSCFYYSEDCNFSSPTKPTKQEAIEAWNSIRITNPEPPIALSVNDNGLPDFKLHTAESEKIHNERLFLAYLKYIDNWDPYRYKKAFDLAKKDVEAFEQLLRG